MPAGRLMSGQGGAPRGLKDKVRSMFGAISPRYDRLNAFMSLGRDHFWRDALSRRMIILEGEGQFLDLATGTGDQLITLRERHPRASVTGVDFSGPMLAIARDKTAEQNRRLPPGSPKPRLILGDIVDTGLPDGRFDSVSISFALRSLPNRKPVYREALRVLKPGGRFALLELWHDPRPLWAPLAKLHIETLIPLLAEALFGADPTAYQFLGRSIIAFPDPWRILAELGEAGMVGLGHRTYTFGAVMLAWGQKPL
jgi:demethylmenaquinone methyltransferase/2-methoxy-6-polyprenyl-1,4-benzoquinol methylase